MLVPTLLNIFSVASSRIDLVMLIQICLQLGYRTYSHSLNSRRVEEKLVNLQKHHLSGFQEKNGEFEALLPGKGHLLLVRHGVTAAGDVR